MKLLKITTIYPSYLDSFYAEHPGLNEKSYEEQKRALDHDAFGWADFWSHALSPLGYDVMEVNLNVDPLQRAWAKEHLLSNPEKIDLEEIALAQIERFKPDILWFEIFNDTLLEKVLSRKSSIKLILGWAGSAITTTLSSMRHIDLILSCAPESVAYLNKAGLKAAHIHHAFDPRIKSRIDKRTKTIDVSFIGQILHGSQYHKHREYLLEKLTSKINIQIYSSSADKLAEKFKTYLKICAYCGFKAAKAIRIPEAALNSLPLIGKAARWTAMPPLPVNLVNSRLKPFIRPGVFGMKMFQVLHDSNITLNIHADSSPLYASNMRLFESTGAGTCLVTDWKDNISELFEPDKEVVVFRSIEECIEKIKWLLDNPQERMKIAAAGEARILKDHTFSHRALQFDEIVRARI